MSLKILKPYGTNPVDIELCKYLCRVLTLLDIRRNSGIFSVLKKSGNILFLLEIRDFCISFVNYKPNDENIIN